MLRKERFLFDLQIKPTGLNFERKTKNDSSLLLHCLFCSEPPAGSVSEANNPFGITRIKRYLVNIK
jgi:hypothetical protein